MRKLDFTMWRRRLVFWLVDAYFTAIQELFGKFARLDYFYGMVSNMLTLAEAIALGRLSEFALQEEARGVGPINRAELDALTAALIKAPQSEGQTSHSPLRDGSTGKRTRQGTARHILR